MLFVFLCKLYVLEIVVHISKKLSKEEKYLDKMSYFNGFAKGKKQSCHQSFNLEEVPGYQPPRDFNADILDTLGRGSIGGRGICKQWEEYYDQPGKRAESGSSTEAYAKGEGKKVTHQLWQEAMGNNYQNVLALLDNQSMVSTSQVAGGPF